MLDMVVTHCTVNIKTCPQLYEGLYQRRNAVLKVGVAQESQTDRQTDHCNIEIDKDRTGK